MKSNQAMSGQRDSLRVAKLLLLLGIVCLFCQPATGFAGEFSVKSFPIPINVEGERTPSSLFLKFEIRYYNVPLDQFASSTLDDRERAFFQLAEGIRKKDYTQVERLLQPLKKESGQSGTAVIAEDQSIKKRVDLYWSAFGGFQNIQVICQVLVGSRNLFVWEAKTGNVRMQRAFAIGHGQDKGLIAREVTMNTPVDLLIVNALDYSAKQPGDYKPLADLMLQYQYPIPVDGASNAGPHPVYLQFNGEPSNFEVFDQKASAPNDALSFYRNAYLSLKNKVVDRFMQFHTPKSQAKLRQRYSTMPAGGFDTYVSTFTKARSVKFVMNADPVYIVFYSDDGSEDWRLGTLGYQYIVRDKNSKELKIANILFESFLDDLLKNNQLFDQSVFKKP